MLLFASSFSLFLCLSFLSLLCYAQPSPAFFSFTYSISVVLPSSSLHLRVVRRDGVHFCYLIFIVESFAASLSGVKFTPVAVRGRKLTRVLKTTSKNDYSEINNNDITAPRSIRAEMVFIGWPGFSRCVMFDVRIETYVMINNAFPSTLKAVDLRSHSIWLRLACDWNGTIWYNMLQLY